MSSVDGSGTFRLGDVPVKRLGYGAMRLSGPGIFGPPTRAQPFCGPPHDSTAPELSGRSPRASRAQPGFEGVSVVTIARRRRRGLLET